MSAVLLYEDQSWEFKVPLKELKIQRMIQCFSTQFKNVPEEFLFQYFDSEEDLINIVCQEDLDALKAANKEEKVNIFAYAAKGGFKRVGLN